MTSILTHGRVSASSATTRPGIVRSPAAAGSSSEAAGGRYGSCGIVMRPHHRRGGPRGKASGKWAGGDGFRGARSPVTCPPKTMSEHDAGPIVGMNHFTVLADDLERTRAFYQLLGLEPGERPPLGF